MTEGGVKMTTAPAPPKKRRGRTVKACEGCRALKVRCQFTYPALVCDKCIELNTPCTMLPKALAASQPPRKRRTPSSAKRAADAKDSTPDQSSSNPETSPVQAAAAPAGTAEPFLASNVGSENHELLHGTTAAADRDAGVRTPAGGLRELDAAEPPGGAAAPHGIVAGAALAHGTMHSPLNSTPHHSLHSSADSSVTNAAHSPALTADLVMPTQGSNIDTTFDSQYPPFDLRAVLDPSTFVPEPSPMTPELLDGPGILDPHIPEMFYFDGASDNQPFSSSVEPSKDLFEDDIFQTNPGNRIQFNTSPMYMAIRRLEPSLQSNFGITSRLLKGNARPHLMRNIISLGVLSREHVLELVSIYRMHLNHWVLLPTTGELESLVNHILQKCPLLVTVCCAVALRLCSREAWSRYYPAVVDHLNKELSINLARSPQNVEFLQAIMLVSIYATSLTYQEHVFDSWYLSGMGIQQCMTNTALLETVTHHHLRIWNHLVHVHLHGSMMTGRIPLVDDKCIEMCRKILREPFADRFDNCLLCEILLYEISLKLSVGRITYDEFKAQVSAWRHEWGMVLTMTSVQFADSLRHILQFMARLKHQHDTVKPQPSPASSSTLVDFSNIPYTQPNMQPNMQPDMQPNMQPNMPPEMQPNMPPDMQHTEPPKSDALNAECIESMPTDELISGLRDLNSCVSGIVMPASGRLFRYLSDMLHDIAFSAAVISITVRSILIERAEDSSDANSAISGALNFSRRLAELFHATSRGTDTQQSRCYALVTLLQSVD